MGIKVLGVPYIVDVFRGPTNILKILFISIKNSLKTKKQTSARKYHILSLKTLLFYAPFRVMSLLRKTVSRVLKAKNVEITRLPKIKSRYSFL